MKNALHADKKLEEQFKLATGIKGVGPQAAGMFRC
jgi:hypothetical protein